jgi:hypothetical protein
MFPFVSRANDCVLGRRLNISTQLRHTAVMPGASSLAMETRIPPSQMETPAAGPNARSAAAQPLAEDRQPGVPSTEPPLRQTRSSQPHFEWQALLFRYLPDPLGPTHSVKRFALR